jgi:hypothetical protein
VSSGFGIPVIVALPVVVLTLLFRPWSPAMARVTDVAAFPSPVEVFSANGVPTFLVVPAIVGALLLLASLQFLPSC